MKQFPKDSSDGVHISAHREIASQEHLFSQQGNKNPVGLAYIARLLEVVDEPRDIWLVYELGAKTLATELFTITALSADGLAKSVQHGGFYTALVGSANVLS